MKSDISDLKLNFKNSSVMSSLPTNLRQNNPLFSKMKFRAKSIAQEFVKKEREIIDQVTNWISPT